MQNAIGEIYIDNELYVERNEPEAYRRQHFTKPVKTLTLDDIWYLMEHAKVTMPLTVFTTLKHCYNFDDCLNSISQLRVHRPEYFRKAKR